MYTAVASEPTAGLTSIRPRISALKTLTFDMATEYRRGSTNDGGHSGGTRPSRSGRADDAVEEHDAKDAPPSEVGKQIVRSGLPKRHRRIILAGSPEPQPDRLRPASGSPLPARDERALR